MLSIKKVCHLTSTHKRYDVRIFQKECRSLAKHGFDVTLIVNDDLDDEEVNGVKIVSTRFKPQKRIQRMKNSYKNFLKLSLEVNADIYHFHDPELLPVGNKLKKLGKIVIFDSHENFPLQIKEKEYIPFFLRKIISKLYYFYETYSVKKIDAVIFPCTYNNKTPFEGRAKRIILIDNFPLLDEFFYKFVDEYDQKENAICYIGTLTYDRGITHIIKAAHYANITLILGGEMIPEEYLHEVREMMEFANVDYKGYINRAEIVEVYRKSKVGMCTLLNVGQYNKDDHLPTKAYEYMSMGLPVIQTDSKFVRELLKEYEFGIPVEAENVDQIVDAIQYLLNNPEVAKEMGKNGRRAVEEKFNWSIEEQKLIELYTTL